MSIWSGTVAPTQLSKNWRDWVGVVARLVLGIALIAAGGPKIGRLAANVAQVQLYQLPLPTWLETIIGYAQPFVEVAVGAMLIVGLFTRVNAMLGALAMVAFIGGILWAWSKGLRIDCGCFSAGGVLSPEEETRYVEDILRDIGFLICGVWLWIRPAGALAIDNWLLAPISIPDLATSDLDDPEDDGS